MTVTVSLGEEHIHESERPTFQDVGIEDDAVLCVQ